MKLAAVTLLLALAGCQTAPHNQALADLDEILKSEPRMYLDGNLPASEREQDKLEERLLQKCVEPQMAVFDEGVLTAYQKSFGIPSWFLVYANPVALTFDQKVYACFAEQGAPGRVMWEFRGINYRAGTLVREITRYWEMSRAAPSYSGSFLFLPRGGCGSRGGPGYRLANGQCASWR